MQTYLVILMLSGGTVDVLDMAKQPSFDACLDALATAPTDIRPSLRCTSDVMTLLATTTADPKLAAAANAWGVVRTKPLLANH